MTQKNVSINFPSKCLIKCFINMSHQNVSLICLIKISHQNFSSKCVIKMSHKNVSYKCLIKMSHQNVSSKCPNKMSHQNFSKLEGIGPLITDPLPTSFTTLFKKIWYLTCDTWHMTCDTWWRVKILSKFQLLSFYGLVFWWFRTKGSPTEIMNTKVFLEQPRLHRVC